MEIVRFGVIDVRSPYVKRWANYMTRICIEIVRYGGKKKRSILKCEFDNEIIRFGLFV